MFFYGLLWVTLFCKLCLALSCGIGVLFRGGVVIAFFFCGRRLGAYVVVCGVLIVVEVFGVVRVVVVFEIVVEIGQAVEVVRGRRRHVGFVRGGCRKFLGGLPCMTLGKDGGKDVRQERKDGKGRSGLGEGGMGKETWKEPRSGRWIYSVCCGVGWG